MAELQIRCGKCGKSYPPGVMKCFDQSENLICNSCRGTVQQRSQARPNNFSSSGSNSNSSLGRSSGSSGGGFLGKFSFFKSKIQNKEYMVMGSPEVIKQSEEELGKGVTPLKMRKEASPKVMVSKVYYAKCMDCGYKFRAHKQSSTVKRCPYCGKSNIHEQVELVRDIDTMGLY